MPTYIALLRGINVGGRTKIAMADLRALFAELGHEDVKTYIQSGNVVFKTSQGRAAVAKELESRIAKDLGVTCSVLLRTKAGLARVLKGNPFLGPETDESKLHVTFLAEKPAAEKVTALDPRYGAPDELAVVGSEGYVHAPGGYGRTKLNNTYIEKRLGVAATTRNWRTVNTLHEMAED